MVGLLYIELMKAPTIRNVIQQDCWRQGHKVIPDKKKQNNKRKCRQKNRAIRYISDGPIFKWLDNLLAIS